MKTKDGGPAFPSTFTTRTFVGKGGVQYLEKQTVSSGGMSLRDWFAGQALAYLPIVIRKSTHQVSSKDPETSLKWKNAKEMGELAYEIADAMLAGRMNKPGVSQEGI